MTVKQHLKALLASLWRKVPFDARKQVIGTQHVHYIAVLANGRGLQGTVEVPNTVRTYYGIRAAVEASLLATFGGQPVLYLSLEKTEPALAGAATPLPAVVLS